MQYRLRTLLIVLGVGPPVLAAVLMSVWFIATLPLSWSDVELMGWALAALLAFVLGPVLYVAGWIAVVMLFRRAHRLENHPRRH